MREGWIQALCRCETLPLNLTSEIWSWPIHSLAVLAPKFHLIMALVSGLREV